MEFSHETEENSMTSEKISAKSDSQSRQSCALIPTRETRKLDLHLIDPKLSYARKFHNVTQLRRWVQGYVHTPEGELNSQKAPRYEPEDNFEIDYYDAKTQTENGYVETHEEYTAVADDEQRNPDCKPDEEHQTYRNYGNYRFVNLRKTPQIELVNENGEVTNR